MDTVIRIQILDEVLVYFTLRQYSPERMHLTISPPGKYLDKLSSLHLVCQLV